MSDNVIFLQDKILIKIEHHRIKCHAICTKLLRKLTQKTLRHIFRKVRVCNRDWPAVSAFSYLENFTVSVSTSRE